MSMYAVQIETRDQSNNKSSFDRHIELCATS